MKYARTIIGTPRIRSTNSRARMLQGLFLMTLIKPTIRPMMQAKNRPHSASSSVCPIAASSRLP